MGHRATFFTAVVALSMLACAEDGGDDDVGEADAAPSVCEQQGVLAGHAVRVCAHRKDGSTPPPVDLELTGPVLAAGNMSEQSPCASVPSDSQGFWFEAMHSSGEVWVLGALIPGVSNPLKEGDTISARATVAGGGFSPRRASIVLRDASHELIAYVGEAGDDSELDPPDGIVVSRGKALCTKHHSCGDWSAYDLDVTVAGKTTPVAYATLQTVGPYRVAHGGYEHQASATTCPDWFVAHVAVGITSAP